MNLHDPAPRSLTERRKADRTKIWFAPGDDSADFLDRLEAMQDASPNVPVAELLARLWWDYA